MEETWHIRPWWWPTAGGDYDGQEVMGGAGRSGGGLAMIGDELSK